MIDTLTCPQKKPEKTLSKLAITGLAGLVLSTIAFSAHANLVANGSFETTTLPTPGGKLDGTNLSNWQVTTTSNNTDGSNGKLIFLEYPGKAVYGGVMNLYGSTAQNGGSSTSEFPLTSPSGGNFIVSDASFRNVTLYQQITGLTIGKDYTLTFYQAMGQQTGYAGATQSRWQVTFGGALQYQPLTLLDGSTLKTSYNVTPATGVVNSSSGIAEQVGQLIGGQTQTSTLMTNVSKGFVPWMQQTMTFTATATSELLGILAVGSPGGLPPFALLDGISLTVVPEPNRFLLIAVGGLAFAHMYRRGQRRTVVRA